LLRAGSGGHQRRIDFGARTVLFGFSQVALVFSHREADTGPAEPRPRRRLRRWSRVLGSALSLVVALVLLAVSAAVHESSPSPDAFYTPPDAVASQPGVLVQHAFTAGAMLVLPQILAQGWVLVATDYTGLGTEGPTPFLIGQGEARSVLDAVRAARQLKQVSLADKTVIRGHSQGGHAALWAGILAPAYAPGDNVIGVAAPAPASD
jgi:hypothetical protein